MAHVGTVLVLAAGQGTRMRGTLPKVLHELCGRPMLGYVLDQARALRPERVVVVVGHGGEEVERWVRAAEPGGDEVVFVTQAEQKGTGHAVQVAAESLGRGPVVVLYGDMPLLGAESLERLCAARGDAPAAALTACPVRPRGFGRILRDASGAFRGVREEKDASLSELEIREVNVGVYCFDGGALAGALPRLSNENAQGEYYLTDVLGMFVTAGESVPTVMLEDEREAIGVNSLDHLAEARTGIQERILLRHLENGVFVEDPATTYVDHDVEIGPGTRILPCTVLREGVRIGAGCEVGPFTHLRGATVLLDGAEVGNFTEAKKAVVGEGTKAKHLSYLGDVTIGKNTNVGAGTIVANYDGKAKHHTEVGDRVFIGSGSILIAPTTLGDGALTGAGAVVKRDSTIPSGEVWVGVPARSIGKKKA